MRVSESVLTQLAQRHRQFLDFITSRVGSRDEAEDLLQAAFLKVLEKGGTLENKGSAVAWFYRLLRNEIVDRHRHAAAHRRALERQAGEAETTTGLDQEFERTACRCVLAVVDDLKPEYAMLLRRVDVQGEGLGDVARGLSLSPVNARVRLHRARAALRRQVRLTCRTCATHGCLDCSCGV